MVPAGSRHAIRLTDARGDVRSTQESSAAPFAANVAPDASTKRDVATSTGTDQGAAPPATDGQSAHITAATAPHATVRVLTTLADLPFRALSLSAGDGMGES
jgi:hypothetical protein